MRKIMWRIRLYFSMESTVFDDVTYELRQIKKWLKRNRHLEHGEETADQMEDLQLQIQEVEYLLIEFKQERDADKMEI